MLVTLGDCWTNLVICSCIATVLGSWPLECIPGILLLLQHQDVEEDAVADTPVALGLSTTITEVEETAVPRT